MSIKFLVLGGEFGFGGGVPILFLWARGFSENWVSFSLRGNLRIAFLLPQNDHFSHEMKGLRKGAFYGLRENL